jgi:hypothetical protein
MTSDRDSAALVNRVADEKLLAEDPANVPAAVGRPEVVPATTTRGRLVGVGATLTGVTLLAGIALVALGVIDAASGGIGLLSVVAIVLGALLAGTHWGWVHVAEATADAIESRRNAPVVARRRSWLHAIEPYTRYEVTTVVSDDGSIAIERVEFRPVPSGDRSFTFKRRTERVAVYSGEESAAAIAEHVELARQRAAQDTERERQRFEVAADAYQREQLGETDQREQVAVRRAASEALSEQINAHLHDPPIG